MLGTWADRSEAAPAPSASHQNPAAPQKLKTVHESARVSLDISLALDRELCSRNGEGDRPAVALDEGPLTVPAVASLTTWALMGFQHDLKVIYVCARDLALPG